MARAEVVVVGAGINGVLTSYFLVERGFNDIVIVEKHYPGSGGTYRCATGIRASFTSAEHVEAMKRSIELWDQLSKKHGFDYRRDGYLWMLSSEEHVEMFKKIVDFHHKLGVNTRIVSVEEIKEIVPDIKPEGLVAGVYDPLAGKADNFRSLLNILSFILNKGVKLYTNTEAKKIIVENNRVKGVETSRGVIEADKVVIAAGYGSREIAKTAGLDLPLENIPKHALITEAYKYRIKPLLIDWTSSSYLVQVFHGGILIGAELEEEPDKPAINRIEYLYTAARIWVKYFPWLAEAHILRYWTGYYVMTPDHHPIIGPVEDIEGLYLITGFSGHGFMMAPAASEALADYIVEGRPRLKIMENLRYERFKRGKLIKEIAVFG